MSPPVISLVRAQRELWRHLWNWTLGALLVVWLTLVAVAWYTGHHEAEEITDGQLIAVARLWLAAEPGVVSTPPAPLDRRRVKAYVQDLAVLQWVGDRLVTDTHGLADGLGLSAAPPNGLSELNRHGAGGSRYWRVYVAERTDGGSTRRRCARPRTRASSGCHLRRAGSVPTGRWAARRTSPARRPGRGCRSPAGRPPTAAPPGPAHRPSRGGDPAARGVWTRHRARPPATAVPPRSAGRR